jgi:hypothetical protein
MDKQHISTGEEYVFLQSVRQEIRRAGNISVTFT